MVLADPGVGKTSISLAAFKILKKMGVAKRALIVAPLRPLHLVWPQELKRWIDFHGFTHTILHGDNKDADLNLDVDIAMTNFEGLSWLLDWQAVKVGKKMQVTVNKERLRKLGFDTLIIDELSKFKNYTSIRFKAMSQIIMFFQRRWGLTGSPAPRDLMNLFPQCLIIDEGRTMGRYITHFRTKYFDQSPWNQYEWTLRKGSDKKIYKAVKPLAIRLEAKGLPPVHDNDIFVDLPEKALKVHKDLYEDLLTKIDGKFLSAASAGVASMKCRQVASGAIYLDPERDGVMKVKERKVKLIHETKLDALEDLIDELQGQQLLIAYEFNHELERLQKRFKGLPYIGGGVSPKEVERLVGLWNRGELVNLAVHPASIGHGVNMQAMSAKHLCWLTVTWDYELYDQLIRRLRRRGTQADTITNHRIFANKTIDLDVRASLMRKQSGQQALFDALKGRKR